MVAAVPNGYAFIGIQPENPNPQFNPQTGHGGVQRVDLWALRSVAGSASENACKVSGGGSLCDGYMDGDECA